MASTLLAVVMLVSMATGGQAAATALMTYDGTGCTTLDQTFTVTSVSVEGEPAAEGPTGDLCSGCTETTVTSASKGDQGTMYANFKSFAAKNEVHVFTQERSNCPYDASGFGMSMSMSSTVMADWDKLKNGECIDAKLLLLDGQTWKSEQKSIKLTGTCSITTPTNMAKHSTLGGLLIALVTMHVVFLGQ